MFSEIVLIFVRVSIIYFISFNLDLLRKMFEFIFFKNEQALYEYNIILMINN